MLIKDIITKIEQKYPLSTQSPWDNSGVQIGDLNQELTGIYISLDAEIANIKEAIKNNCNLIITHHPLIFSGIKRLVKGEFNYSVIELAMAHKLTIYSSHTPFDASPDGMKNTPLLELGEDVNYDFVEEDHITFGTTMNVAPQSLSEFVEKIKNKLKRYGLTDNMRVYQANDKPIQKVAIMGGSGAGFIEHAKRIGADLYVTADVKYHDAQLAKRIGINLIDLTHDGSEIHFVDIMKKQLEQETKIITSYQTIKPS